MRHRASRPLLDPVRRCAAVLTSRRGIYVAAPTCALALVAGGAVASLDLGGDPGGDGAPASGALNRAGAFAQASGSITDDPSSQAGGPSPSRTGRPSRGEASRSAGPSASSAAARSQRGSASALPGSASSPTTGTPTSSGGSDGPTPSNPGTPSGSSSPTGSPSSTPSSDSTPPETDIVAGPADNGTGAFEFVANEPATFECNLDGAGWESCVSGLSLPGLQAGWHTLSVRAIDAAGNVDASPAVWEWHASGA